MNVRMIVKAAKVAVPAIAGIGAVAGTIHFVRKGTPKAKEAIQEFKEDIAAVDELLDLIEANPERAEEKGISYNDDDAVNDYYAATFKLARSVIKAYAPAIVCGAVVVGVGAMGAKKLVPVVKKTLVCHTKKKSFVNLDIAMLYDNPEARFDLCGLVMRNIDTTPRYKEILCEIVAEKLADADVDVTNYAAFGDALVTALGADHEYVMSNVMCDATHNVNPLWKHASVMFKGKRVYAEEILKHVNATIVRTA